MFTYFMLEIVIATHNLFQVGEIIFIEFKPLQSIIKDDNTN